MFYLTVHKMILPMPLQKDTLFKASLITLTLMILGMVVIGGLTRLTGSGLSIVEWKPVTGILPPLTLQDWLGEFSKYQQSPEFKAINSSMTLQEFQSIFWLEYIHRLWGRLLGFVLLIPTLLMVFQKQYRALWPFLSFLWGLGLAQGVMGWIMVKSGLVHDPHVSPYRLALHLFLGFAIFGVALWMTFRIYQDRLSFSKNELSLKTLRFLTLITLACVLLTAFLGALVAGLRAGLLYNTFPYIGESLVPHELFTTSPWWKDLFENPVSVQFLHRLFAIGTALLCVSLWAYQQTLQLPKSLSYVYTGVALAAFFQVFLGIMTLLFVVPIGLAVFHQAFAFILFGTLLYALFLMHGRQ